MKRDLLMPFEESRKIDFEGVYFYRFAKNDQNLYYLGTEHSNDPAHPQFNEIHGHWNNFLHETQESKRLVLVEGGVPPVEQSEKEAVRKFGESGLMSFLANRADIACDTPEPPEEYKNEQLFEKFTLDQIAYRQFVRSISMWTMQSPKPNFDAYVIEHMKHFLTGQIWCGFEVSMPHMMSIHAQLFNYRFDKNDLEPVLKMIDPREGGTIINELDSWENEYIREFYILEQIEKYWKSGASLFIVYGSSHAVRHEPVIRDFVGG